VGGSEKPYFIANGILQKTISLQLGVYFIANGTPFRTFHCKWEWLSPCGSMVWRLDDVISLPGLSFILNILIKDILMKDCIIILLIYRKISFATFL